MLNRADVSRCVRERRSVTSAGSTPILPDSRPSTSVSDDWMRSRICKERQWPAQIGKSSGTNLALMSTRYCVIECERQAKVLQLIQDAQKVWTEVCRFQGDIVRLEGRYEGLGDGLRAEEISEALTSCLQMDHALQKGRRHRLMVSL